MAKIKTEFSTSLAMNTYTYLEYYNMLMEIACASIEWVNIPESLNAPYLEYTLNTKGQAVFYRDEYADIWLALQCVTGGKYNVFNIPKRRRAYAENGYSYRLRPDNSVMIYNNYMHTTIMNKIEMFARRLYDIDRTIDVNMCAQKTPVLILCDENERLTLINIYKEYSGNAPVIKGYKGFDKESFTVLKTDAPFIADKAYQIKVNYWNEALCYLGINNSVINKAERSVHNEIEYSQGGVYACRNARLYMREEACRQINEKFGLDIGVRFRENLVLAQAEDVQRAGADE